ncbi:MAG: sulfatase-like hydrolase/transferase [Planctomycetes bacterium]|nr:sulfatase-like hydrolase/transferase [Planctomycetota bacterium]
MSIRPLLLLLVVLSLAAVERPNVVWIVSEDNSPYLGCYGEPLARTPVIDGMAKQGVRYTNARSAAPVCAPSRCSIITARFAVALGTQNMRSRWPIPDNLRYFPEHLRDAGYYCTNNAKTDYNVGNDRIKESWDESSKTAHWKNRPAGKPFFAVFNTELTHESSLHKRQPLTTDPAKVRVPAYLPDLPAVRQDIAQYHDRIALMDAFVGMKLQELEEAGLLEATIVVYYSDHGGAIPRGKRFLYDSGTLVPLVVRVPERFTDLAPQAVGTVCDDQVNLIDLGPTVLSWCGVALPSGIHGRAIAGPARSPAPAVGFAFRDRMDEKFDSGRAVYDQRYTYIRNYDPLVPHGQHLGYLWQAASMQAWADAFAAGTLTPAQAAFFKPKAVEELYDRTTDPDNVVNLAADPARATDLARLRAALQARLLAIRDSVAAPETVLAELRRDQPALTHLAEESRYPLARLLPLIDRIQVGRDAAAVAASLGDAHPLVRWWGASGAALLSEEPAALATLLNDPVIAVRIAAAESILRRRSDPAAVAALNTVLSTQADWLPRLAAANSISRLDDRTPFRAALEATKQDEEYTKRIVPWLLGRKPPAK